MYPPDNRKVAVGGPPCSMVVTCDQNIHFANSETNKNISRESSKTNTLKLIPSMFSGVSG